MDVRPILDSERDWAAAVVAQHFGTPEVISRGVRHDTRQLPGLVAEAQGERVGLLHYHIVGARCEVVAHAPAPTQQEEGQQERERDQEQDQEQDNGKSLPKSGTCNALAAAVRPRNALTPPVTPQTMIIAMRCQA